MTENSIRTEHAAAIRAVNAAYNRLPRSAQNAMLITYDDLDVEVDVAVASGDRIRALAAITRFRDHWLAEFVEAAR